jgi:hypothetical protein
MVVLTVYTSGCFVIVSLAGIIKNTWMGPWFFILSILSLLNHTFTRVDENGIRTQTNNVINICDKCVAHYITGRVVIHYLYLPTYSIVYLVCLFWVIYAYKIKNLCALPGRRGELFHCSIHVASSLGCLMLTL